MPGLILKDERDRSDLMIRYEEPSRPCPTNQLSSYLKQINRSQLNAVEAGFLNAAFGGFLTGIRPPGAVSALLAESSNASAESIYENRIPRRYDGDNTLPPGRYSTVCEDAFGDDGGTLAREMRFYFEPAAAEGHIEILDSTLPEDVPQLKAAGMGISQDEPRVIIRYFPFASSYGEPGSCVTFAVPLIVKKANVERVLDLRRPDAANWLARTISSLAFLDSGGTKYRAYVNRPDLTDFSQIIYSLLDQAKGGGNFHKITGLYLRQLGVAGLVFPSARGDAKVEFINGTFTSCSGWSFVDFQNAPSPNIFAFFELRPHWPTELVNEGGDDNTPGPPTFASQVAISAEGYSSSRGHLSVRGLQSRMKAYYWFASASEAVRYRLRASPTDVEYLRRFVVSMDAEQAGNFSAMILFSILGNPLARNNLSEVLKNQLRGHPINSLLYACLKPLPATDEQRKSLERFFSKAFSAGAKSTPEPAT